ncbi:MULTISPECIES: sigma-70 family RNA polymerase sigma factor [unclassified Arsukibacterium]|uniref:sigma-70 family RNA polymerase sigma factor n=1 Tax=unclassified Arsukibacterium TaxID=2635278 RepID=UPI0025BEE114|nr:MULTISPECIES: sigma-70 family RNA polymerase sigma factor [unclassified Arsukibacterium]|tara:strand:+ start:332 stop:922 length:591 start_codon:yes stop_codon:yes gene_type:complete
MAWSVILPGWFNRSSCADELMQQFQQSGQLQWLDKLIMQCGDDLYHFLLRQADAQLAADICQQCWLKVLENRHSYRAESRFKTWLFTLARNALVDELRRQQRWQLSADKDSEVSVEALRMGQEGIAEQLALLQQKERLAGALAALPTLQREAILLQLEEFSLDDIAHITRELPETIKSRLRYARERLALLMGEDNV